MDGNNNNTKKNEKFRNDWQHCFRFRRNSIAPRDGENEIPTSLEMLKIMQIERFQELDQCFLRLLHWRLANRLDENGRKSLLWGKSHQSVYCSPRSPFFVMSIGHKLNLLLKYSFTALQLFTNVEQCTGRYELRNTCADGASQVNAIQTANHRLRVRLVLCRLCDYFIRFSHYSYSCLDEITFAGLITIQ